jgi:diguanylate cyclase (GGDEF)-like protein
MSTSRSEHATIWSQQRDRSSTERRRPWKTATRVTVLALVAGGFVVHGLMLAAAAEASPAGLTDAAIPKSLIVREQAMEARLLEAAGDGSLVQLIDGISGEPERRFASRTLEALRGPDGIIISDVCITRLSDRNRTILGGDATAAVCASKAVRRSVAAAPRGTVVQTLPIASDGRRRLLLTTALVAAPKTAASVISAEVDVQALLADLMPIDAGAVAAMLVDLDTSVVLASAGDLSMADTSTTETSDGLEPYVSSILSGGRPSTGTAEGQGLGATISPLWTTTNGTRLGLIEVSPVALPPTAAESAGILLPIVGGVLGLALLLIGWSIRRAGRRSKGATRIEALYREAQAGSNEDPLTGLGNRGAYEKELAHRAQAYLDSGVTFVVAHLDVDDLSAVNDSEGQQAGDEILIGVAETLQQLLRREDEVFRIDGDEFAVLMPGLTATTAAPSLERALHFSRRPPSGIRPSSFSCGISGVPEFSTDADIVGQQATVVLEWVKSHGRGAVELYDPDRDQVADQPHDIASMAVQEVITGKLLSPVFQPIVDLRSGRVLGFEGLVRPDAMGPLPSTSHLFAAASASGRTVELDLACIEVVLAAARDIGSDRLLTLNLSPKTLEMKDFGTGWLLEALVRHGIAPSRVIVELTEREAIGDMRRLRQAFDYLQGYGVRLAADDVGAGNSGLRLLSQLKFDIVKIDLALVQEGVHHPGSRAVLESLRDLAMGQQAHVVAEGVETTEQLQVIQGLDIGAAQGYLLGRPNRSVEASFVDVQRLALGLAVPATATVPVVSGSSDAVVEVVPPQVRLSDPRFSPAPGAA